MIHRAVAGALLISVSAWLIVTAWGVEGVFDEGIVAHGAERLLAGEALYRDFYHQTTPGGHYLYAGLFRFFGTSIATARCGATAILVCLLLVFYRWARFDLGPLDAALLASAYLVVAAPLARATTYHWPCTLAAIVAASARREGRGFLCGLATGLVIAFHHARGLVFLAAIIAAAAWPGGRGARPVGPFRFATGLAAATLSWFPAVAGGSFTAFLDQALLHPAAARSAWAPYGGEAPGPAWLALGYLLIAYGGPVGICFALWRGLRGTPGERVAGADAVVAAALWAGILYNPDPVHILFGSPLAAGIAWRAVVGRGGGWSHAVRLAAAYGAAVVAITSAAAVRDAVPVTTRRGTLLEAGGPPVAAWVRAVEERVAEGERTFIFPHTTGLYFYAGVRNATPFEFAAPIFELSPREWDRLVRRLEADPPPFVFDHWMVFLRLLAREVPGAPAEVYGPNPLGPFLAARYEPVDVVHGLIVWRRRVE